jgi:RNA polymerase sigma factor (sigma-70 family)
MIPAAALESSVPEAPSRALEGLSVARRQIVAVLRRYRVPAEDARDLVQNALLALLQKGDQIENPAAWLTVAVERECLHWLRADRRRLYEAVDAVLLDLTAARTVSPEQETIVAALVRQIQGLKLRCRRLLLLRYKLGCDRDEIAADLDLRPNSVNHLEKRCLAELSRRISRGGATA